jgi:hypothetical protein
MPATRLTGAAAKVEVGTVEIKGAHNWTMTLAAESLDATGYDSEGYKEVEVGNKNASGTVDIKFEKAAAPEKSLTIGASVTLKLYEDATHFWTFMAKILRLEWTVPQAGIVTVRMSYESSGTITVPTWI